AICLNMGSTRRQKPTGSLSSAGRDKSSMGSILVQSPVPGLRKSGMPLSVEIPAPVKTKVSLLCRSISASFLISSMLLSPFLGRRQAAFVFARGPAPAMRTRSCIFPFQAVLAVGRQGALPAQGLAGLAQVAAVKNQE